MNPKVDDDFVPMYLYIEDFYENPESNQQVEESDEDERGVVIIEVF